MRLHMSVLGAFGVAALLVVTPAESPVADAAKRGDIAELRSLLKDGADVNAAQGDGMTALHWAATHNDVAMASVLIYAGANLESTTRLGAYTSLHLASKAGNAPVMEMLLKSGSDANATTATGGVTPLHFAAASGRADAVRALLKHGVKINARDSHSGRTPLMFATAQNRLEVIDALLQGGADVAIATKVVDYVALTKTDGQEQKRRQKIIEAAREADEEARAEQQSVADSAAAELQSEENVAADSAAMGPDSAAAELHSTDEPAQSVADSAAAELQSKEGAAADTTNQPKPLSFSDLVGSQGGLTALHYAARDGRIDAARLLINRGADINQLTLGDSSSPLLVATINGNYELAMFLLEQGADPNLASEDGATPLYATLNNRWAPKALYPQPTAFKQQRTTYLELMKALLAHSADPNTRLKTHIWYTSFNFDLLGVNFQGATPFWRAAYATDVPAMRLLIEYDADPNIPTTKPVRRRRSSDKETEDQSGLPEVPIGGPAVYPIHAASGVGYGVARAGNSHRHAPDGWLPTVKYLVEELGADVNVRDHDGYSAVHNAAARGDNELISYMVEQGADVTFVSRKGQTTVDMANGPQQRVQPFPETIALLESLGAMNNHKCVSC